VNNSLELKMNYPFWDIPYLGSGWVIGIIAIFHVMISQFAVGGGLFLPMAERKALREGRKDWMDELKRHSRFFLLVTFVFGWAIEWVFFLVELTCIAVYYYTWDRIPEKLHLTVGWVYAVSSLCTL